MSSDNIAISAINLTKAYRVYSHPLHRVMHKLGVPGLRGYRQIEALTDVSFDIRKGEAVGIIGRNGSGKSTLLQIICGILKPSSGSINVNGRISALLELGAGFHPEFTGRENAYFQGALMGFTKAGMDKRFDHIASFADIGEFIDQPVRIYSSGMFVRLAFAVAISVDPDILIVDEALSVGDEAFQRKCFSRISSLVQSGRTLLFVSHSPASVIGLCSRALLLDAGKKLEDGLPRTVIDQYHRMILSTGLLTSNPPGPASETMEAQASSQFFDPGLIPESTLHYAEKGVRITSWSLVDEREETVNLLLPAGTYKLRYRVHFEREFRQVRFGMLIKLPSGLELAGAVSHTPNEGIPVVYPGDAYFVEFELDCLLAVGTYYLNCGVLGFGDEEEHYLHRVVDAAMFKVVAERRDGHTGAVRLCSFVSATRKAGASGSGRE